MSINDIGSMRTTLLKADATGWSSPAKLDAETLQPIGPALPGVADKTRSFGEMLMESISQVNGLQEEANQSIQKLVTGENKNLHETMLAVEKAEIAFKTMNQVRMKVIEAYREVMRMQI
jgi:flagellar hook-basal body complex protein FliE